MTAVAVVAPGGVKGHPAEAVPAQVHLVPLTQLVESPWNPRKHFDPTKLAETAESLRVNGQLTPIVVRPMVRKGSKWGDEATPYYEIGAGHRRFRAAPLAGLASLLAVVRPLDDVAFLELLTIENKQREDVTPLDEAAGFRMLMEKAGYDVSKLAARIGLSMKYVYDRLKLLQLIPEAKKYLEEGTITAGHAILLARLKPAEQKRVMGDPKRVNRYQFSAGGGLWQGEDADYDLEQPSLELTRAVKAVSVRELGNYINDHVRFRPEEADPFLFPATAAAMDVVKTEDLTPVYITYDHQLRHEAKDHKVRTYGISSWRRADGQRKSKTCAWSRIGIVAAGRDRGDAFRVCVNRDRCDVHFQAAARAAKRRRASPASRDTSGSTAIQDNLRRQREEAARDAERARWVKARPAVLKALAEKLAATPAGPRSNLADDVLAACIRGGKANTTVARGHTAEDFLRYAAFQLYADDVDDLAPGYYRHADAVKDLRALGIDAAKIVDQVAPKPKPAAKTPTTKPAKKKGRH
jgi:ParB/RepB/Spo0J family partition protein